MSRTLLLVGSHPYDVDSLLSVGDVAREEFGYDLLVASVAPLDVADAVLADVAGRGYPTYPGRLLAFRRDRRNPFAASRAWRAASLAVADRLVADVGPAAVLSTVNPPPGLLLDELARRGVPTVLMQLFFWGDQRFQRTWRREDRRVAEAGLSVAARWRARLDRRSDALFGVGPAAPWDQRRATIAVEGPALARRLVAGGVPAEHVVATGNPVLDGIVALATDAGAGRRRVESTLGIAPTDTVVTHFRSHEDRLHSVDRAAKNESQAAVIRAVRAGAPGARLVVKIHPKEGRAERDLIAAIDPGVVVTGSETDALDLIGASATVIGTFSTTLLHSVALDRPTISAQLWSGLDHWRRVTDWSGVERCTDERDLAAAVRANFTDPAHRSEWANRRADFRKEHFVLDGRGAHNVADLVHRLAGTDG